MTDVSSKYVTTNLVLLDVVSVVAQALLLSSVPASQKDGTCTHLLVEVTFWWSSCTAAVCILFFFDKLASYCCCWLLRSCSSRLTSSLEAPKALLLDDN